MQLGLAESPLTRAHLTMRVDLSPAGRGELSVAAIRLSALKH
jgi:hypothetical protein